jgi:hypothetical protein
LLARLEVDLQNLYPGLEPAPLVASADEGNCPPVGPPVRLPFIEIAWSDAASRLASRGIDQVEMTAPIVQPSLVIKPERDPLDPPGSPGSLLVVESGPSLSPIHANSNQAVTGRRPFDRFDPKREVRNDHSFSTPGCHDGDLGLIVIAEAFAKESKTRPVW